MNNSDFIIRPAEARDIEALTEIYNYEVKYGDATFDINPKSPDERLCWLNEHNKSNHPLVVAEENGVVIGYASLSPYRDKEAYAFTVELSVYVHPQHRKKGAGEALASHVISLAKNDGITVTVISVITSGNNASIKLHQKLGFEFCGEIKNVGKKFGKMLSIQNYQLLL